jgi:hypothetical protein
MQFQCRYPRGMRTRMPGRILPPRGDPARRSGHSNDEGEPHLKRDRGNGKCFHATKSYISITSDTKLRNKVLIACPKSSIGTNLALHTNKISDPRFVDGTEKRGTDAVSDPNNNKQSLALLLRRYAAMQEVAHHVKRCFFALGDLPLSGLHVRPAGSVRLLSRSLGPATRQSIGLRLAHF